MTFIKSAITNSHNNVRRFPFFFFSPGFAPPRFALLHLPEGFLTVPKPYIVHLVLVAAQPSTLLPEGCCASREKLEFYLLPATPSLSVFVFHSLLSRGRTLRCPKFTTFPPGGERERDRAMGSSIHRRRKRPKNCKP